MATPDSVTGIGSRASYDGESLSPVTLPEVSGNGRMVFYEREFLSVVTFPDSVTAIGDCCESFSSVGIPDGVTSAGDGASSIAGENLQPCGGRTSSTTGK